MYNTMLVFKDNNLLEKIKGCAVWGEESGFEITAVADSGDTAYRELCRGRYDLVIYQTDIDSMNGAELLKRASAEKLCGHIVLCSEKADFEYARMGIIYGAFDYFIAPFENEQLYGVFSRIKDEAASGVQDENGRAACIAAFFKNRDDSIYKYVSDMIDEIYSSSPDYSTAENTLRRIYKKTVDDVFSGSDWLDLYKSSHSFYGDDPKCGGKAYGAYITDRLAELFRDYCELFPSVNNEKIREVILYILNNPESDLKQKTIASEYYINSSYLSTIFSSQTQLRFVDYLTTVKLKRAGWLLQNTEMKVTEIAERLDYKDVGYFSRMFKKQYGVTPTEYRIPDGYTYQI